MCKHDYIPFVNGPVGSALTVVLDIFVSRLLVEPYLSLNDVS